MKLAKQVLLLPLLVLVAGVLCAPDTEAIPAFARENGLACSSCHSAVPYLNANGRDFKETGYTEPGKGVPISARLKGYIFDDSDGSDSQIRSIHEVEILSGGKFADKGSWFLEVEGEDEDNFSTAAAGTFSWHQNRQLNFSFGIGSIFHPDPYNSLADGGRRLTVAHKTPLNVGSSVDARFRKDAQYASVWGRSGQFFYLASFSAGNGNPEGVDPNNILGRIAYDFNDDMMVGGFYFDGEDVGGMYDLSRWGIDWNLAFNNLYIVGMFMNAQEELMGGGPTNDNNAGYVEVFFTQQRDDRPFFVPLVRYDFTEANDGVDQISSITAQLGVYVRENFKLALEYTTETDQVPGVPESDRTTLMADVVF